MDVKVLIRFITETGETFSITVPNANEDLTEGEIGGYMDMLISLKTFSSIKGEMIEKKNAQIIKTETTSIK